MRIAIDARMMGAESTRGIGRYLQELLAAMLKRAPEHRYILLTKSSTHPCASHPSVETVVTNIPWYSLREQLQMPRLLSSLRADVVHVPHWNVPLLFHGPLVVTIHDLLLRHIPDSAKLSTRGILARTIKRVGYRLTLDHAVRVARSILVPTHAVAQDLAQLYPRAASKLVVTGEGMPTWTTPSQNFHPQLASLPPSFFFYIGSAYPHKGLEDLLDAWKYFAEAHPECSLVIAGEMDVFMQRIRAQAQIRHLPRIVFLGRVSDVELLELYTRANALVFPSHTEGFGLPPLEAISAGCPVLCSDIPALREVLGSESAIFFRAGDANDILRAMTALASSLPEQRKRTSLIAEKLRLRWNWDQTAERTLDVYKAISL